MKNRKYERFSADIPEISARLFFFEDIRIRDVSMGGISLIAEKGLTIDKEYIVRITMHDKIFSVKGVVMWCRLSRSKNSANGDVIPIYSMGLKFNDDRTDEISKLIEFIRSYWNQVPDGIELEEVDTGTVVFTGENEKILPIVAKGIRDKEKIFALFEK